MKTSIKFITFSLAILFLTGCGSKSEGLYNLPPHAWYNQIMDDIRVNDLDEADKHYNQFSSEHISSPMLEPTLMILAMAHMDDNSYTRANELLDEYIRRFGTREKIEYAQFLQIKANYDSFLQPNRNQNLMYDSINKINTFLSQYPNTKYRPLLETMLIKFKLAVYHLDENIMNLYTQTGRDVSAKIYEERLKQSDLKDANLIKPDLPWYRAFFE
ncbi:MAG: outer membrane protein assembly factor BamD [Campylobacteraceae bacterium]|nr:outer membrane protein assembly factor BamD [Campylobacteraceae bacterium]